MRDECTRTEAEISALLDGELPAPEAAAVEAHVRSCPDCAALARDLAAVGRTLRDARAGTPVPVSSGFRAGVLARVGVEAGRPRPVAPPSSSRAPAPAGRLLHFLPAASAAAAGFAAVMIAGAYAGSRMAVREEGPRAPVVPGPTAAPVSDPALLLASAGKHRAEGRADLERRDLLAALGAAPGDPAVREAFARTFGFDPAATGALPAVAGTAPTAPAAGPPLLVDAADPGGPELWVGSLRFENPGAYDAFTAFRERARGLEMELASRAPAGTEPVTVAAERPVAAKPDPLSLALASLVVGPAAGGDGSASYQGITVFPLHRAGGGDAPRGDLPLSLGAAMESGRAVVRDGPGRSVATVLVTNLDPERPLLVLAGEVLEGGRADRLVARDVLVAPGARGVAVPVYEAEAGRSSAHPYGSRFRSVAGVAGPRVRGLALGQAKPEDLRAFLRERLDLLDVTSTLHRSLADAWSERGPAAPVLRKVRPRLQEALRGLQGPDVVGFAVAQGRDILAVEVFGSHDLMAREARRILDGCAVEASTYPGGGRPPTTAEVGALLAAAGRGTAVRAADGNPGEVGFVARVGGLLGSGVTRDGAVLHASVLPGGPGGAGGARGGKSEGGPDEGGQPSTGPAAGDGAPAPGSGGSADGEGPPPPATGTGSGDGKRPEPPPPAGERPR